MRRQHYLPLLASLTVVAILTLTTGFAHAAPQAITMTPTSSSPVIMPGAVYKGSFDVINQGQSGYAFTVYAAPYHVDGEDYTPDFTTLPNTTSVDKWFTLSSSGGHINPGQTATINYTVAVPANTAPGGYYAVLFAQTQYPKTANSITLNERVGEIFYLQAAGTVTQKGQLLSWGAGVFQRPPLTTTLRLENSGGVHYPATIRVNVRDIFGHSKYGLYTVKEVLPQTIRRTTITWNKTPAIGIFKITGTVNYLNKTVPLHTQWVFVMSPNVRLSLVIVLVLIVLFALARFIYRKRKAKKAAQTNE